MYAVTVGTALPRLDEKTLDFSCPLLWGVAFMLVIFLEDFYLYHKEVVPNLSAFPSARGFVLAMLIIGTWYVGQASFPSKPRLFLASFAFFFLLKSVGGVLMAATKYPSRRDVLFLLPVSVALVLFVVSNCSLFTSHPARLLYVLAPIWFLTVTLWWLCDIGPSVGKPRSAGST
jgi:hypothetical protein